MHQSCTGAFVMVSAGVVRDKVNVEMIPEDFNYLTV